MAQCQPIPIKPRDIVCNVDGCDHCDTWIVSFYDSDTGDSAGNDSTEFDSMTDAVEYAEATRRTARHDMFRIPGDRITIIVDGNG